MQCWRVGVSSLPGAHGLPIPVLWLPVVRCRCAHAGGWQEQLTSARLTHGTRFGHLAHGLNLLATLCSLAVSAPALAQVAVVRCPGPSLRV